MLFSNLVLLDREAVTSYSLNENGFFKFGEAFVRLHFFTLAPKDNDTGVTGIVAMLAAT